MAAPLDVGVREVRVIGLGNPILTDDGVGLHVIRALVERRLGHSTVPANLSSRGPEARGIWAGERAIPQAPSQIPPLCCAQGRNDDGTLRGIEDWCECIEAEVAGFSLLELLQGRRRVILVDAIARPGVEPGTVMRLAPDDFATTPRLRAVHELDLPSALGLGRVLGLDMPEEVVIFAVQAADLWTFGESLTPSVAAAVPVVVEEVTAQLEAWDRAGHYGEL